MGQNIREASVSPLEKGLADKTAVIGIIGLGYVGLPLAVTFAQAGFRVIGFDIQTEKVEAVNRGKSYIADISSEALANLVTGNHLQATTDQSRLQEADAICVCVPTPLYKTKEPDLSYVTHETEEIAKYLRRGQLIVLESTTYPGTTREVMLPILEHRGLKAGQDFYLAYSPERIDPGNRKYRIQDTPKLVGGVDGESATLAALLYRQAINRVIVVSSSEVAEMAKVFENVFRNVNIALVNELAALCERMGISVWDVIDAATSKPFGYMPFYPGPGVGGHCIPIDPHYLSSKAREYNFRTRFIELAAEINERMPSNVVSRIFEILNANGKSIRGAKLLLLGLAFKKDVADVRASPSLELVQLLSKRGAEIVYNDPYVPEIRIGNAVLTSVEINKELLSSADCVIIATDHSIYDYQYVIDNASVVFDTRGVTRTFKARNVFRLGE
jgi:UDP-N-acetyl-D-glucosamine dehydrogenase